MLDTVTRAADGMAAIRAAIAEAGIQEVTAEGAAVVEEMAVEEAVDARRV